MELFEAVHEIKYLAIRRGARGVVLLRSADDDIDDVRKTAAAATALLHGVVHLGGYDELPTVLVEEGVDHLGDFLFSDEIAAAHQHVVLPAIRNVLSFRD
jgi:hypothetical protein